MIRAVAIIAAGIACMVLLAPTARSGTRLVPPTSFVEGALCVHAGWHYTSHRPRPGLRPDYWLFGHGYWRTWKLPYGTGSEGEGSWSGVVGSLYGGGMSFTVGTWNEAAGYSHGSVPRVSSTYSIARQPPSVQIVATWLIVRKRGHWGDWPQTSRACGLR